MNLTTHNWKNKKDNFATCTCGSSKQHWIKYSDEIWPRKCIVDGCLNEAAVGGHIINTAAQGERIAPLCESCNKNDGYFDLKEGETIIAVYEGYPCK